METILTAPMRYVRIGEQRFQLVASFGRIKNPNFYDRDTKNFTIKADYNTAAQIVASGEHWRIAETYNATSEELIPSNAAEILRDEDGSVIGFVMEYDNSEYNIPGDITVHNDGTVTIEYGKPSELDKTSAALDAMVYAALTE